MPRDKRTSETSAKKKDHSTKDRSGGTLQKKSTAVRKAEAPLLQVDSVRRVDAKSAVSLRAPLPSIPVRTPYVVKSSASAPQGVVHHGSINRNGGLGSAKDLFEGVGSVRQDPASGTVRLASRPTRKNGTAQHAVVYTLSTLAGLTAIGFLLWYVLADGRTAEEKRIAYVDAIVQKVSIHAVLPAHENPTIGVIADPATVKDNKAFFKNASQGDYLLVYPHARLMVIYSPSKNKIVNMGYSGAVQDLGEPSDPRAEDTTR